MAAARDTHAHAIKTLGRQHTRTQTQIAYGSCLIATAAALLLSKPKHVTKTRADTPSHVTTQHCQPPHPTHNKFSCAAAAASDNHCSVHGRSPRLDCIHAVKAGTRRVNAARVTIMHVVLLVLAIAAALQLVVKGPAAECDFTPQKTQHPLVIRLSFIIAIGAAMCGSAIISALNRIMQRHGHDTHLHIQGASAAAPLYCCCCCFCFCKL